MADSKLCDEIENKMKITETTETWSSEHLTELPQKLASFYVTQLFCDVTLISADDEYEVKAHKNVLAANSKYFLAMFGGSLSESEANEVKLSQIDGQSLKLIIYFIYHGDIELSADTAEAVFKGAHFFELPSLEKLCWRYIKKNIDVSNCWGVLLLADRCNCAELHEAAMVYTRENFAALRDKPEFCEQNLDKLWEIISSDDLRIPSEVDVFHSIMKWIDFDKDNRKEFFEKLLHCVRLLLLPPHLIATVIEPVCESYESLRILYEVFKFHMVPNLRSTILSDEHSKIRNVKDVIVAISGCENSDADLRVGLYYSGQKEWVHTKWPATPFRETDLKRTVLHDKVFVAGKSEEQYYLDLKTLEWKQSPQLFCRQEALVTLNGSVFAFTEGTVCKLEDSLEKWKILKIPKEFLLPEGAKYAIYKDLVYFYKPDSYTIYDTVNNTWDTVELPLLHYKSPVIGVHIIRLLLSDFLIEITENIAYVYNLETCSWDIRNHISFDKACNRTALHDKKIIIYGGNKFYEYDVFENQMQELPTLINNKREVDILLTNNKTGVC